MIIREMFNKDIKLIKYEAIRNSVTIERRERGENAKTFLKDNLSEATIYVNGDVVSLNSKDYQNKINEALGKLVATVYNKLYYIEHAFDSGDVRRLFEDHSANSINLDGTDIPANKHALDDVLSFIHLNTQAHMKISMKAVKEQFMKAPYGFVEDDIYWLVAKQFVSGGLAFTVNGESVTLQNKVHSELIDYITKKQYAEKLLIEERIGVDPKQKKAAKNIAKELFNSSVVNDDEDAIMKEFQTFFNKLPISLTGAKANNQLKVFLSLKNSNDSSCKNKKAHITWRILSRSETLSIFWSLSKLNVSTRSDTPK